VKTDSKVGRQVAAYRQQLRALAQGEMANAHLTTREGSALEPEPFDLDRDDLPKPFGFGLPPAPSPASAPRLKHWPEAVDKALKDALMGNKTRGELIAAARGAHSDGFAEASDDQILSHAHVLTRHLSCRPWTDEEDGLIERSGLTAGRLARRLAGRTVASITARVTQLTGQVRPGRGG
jgi:hypothetical protein